MEGIKVYILEDEIVTRKLLQKQLERHGYVVCGSSGYAETAYEGIQRTKPDIAILDINVKGDKTGIWLGEKLDIPFVYLTANKDIDTIKSAVRTEPVGYLIKPFKEMDVFAMIEMTVNHLKKEMSVAGSEVGQEEIVIKDGRNHVKVRIDEIHYIKSEGKYIEVYLKDKRVVSRQSLVGFANKMNASSIMRVHGSYLINLSRVESYSASSVTVLGADIPISRRYRKEFMERVKG